MDKKLIQISAIIFFLTLVIANKAVYQPKKEMLRKLNKEKTYLMNRAELLTEMKEIQKRMDYYGQSMFPEKKMSLFLDELIKIANRAEISLHSITPQPLVEYGVYTQLPVEITTQASYHQLARFISRLESSKQFIRLDKMNISSKGGYEDRIEKGAVLAVRLSVSTIYLE